MNATDNRKSMDDVLASIRRIVRAEKDPDMAETGTGEGQPHRAWDDEPLPLTPDMRTDGDAVQPEAIAHPAEAGAPGAVSSVPDRQVLKELVREVLLEELSRDRAGQAVREIIRDELVNGEVGGNISQNVLRLIRSEIDKALAGR